MFTDCINLTNTRTFKICMFIINRMDEANCIRLCKILIFCFLLLFFFCMFVLYISNKKGCVYRSESFVHLRMIIMNV